MSTARTPAPGTPRRSRRNVRSPRALISVLPNTDGAQTPTTAAPASHGTVPQARTGGALTDPVLADTAEDEDADLDDLDPSEDRARVAAALIREMGDQAFLNRLANRSRLAETGGIYQAEVAMYTAWMASSHPDTPLEGATATHIAAYRDHLQELGLAQSTVRLSLAALRTFYDFRRNLPKNSPKNPARQVPLPPRGPVNLRPYTPAEARRIMTTIRSAMEAAKADGDMVAWFYAARDYAMLATVYLAGLRRGEIRRLRGTDLHLDQPLPQISVRGKGNKPNKITIPQLLAGILRGYLTEVRGPIGDHDFVFAHLETSNDEVSWVYAGLTSEENRLLSARLVRKVREEQQLGYGIGPYTLGAAAQRWGIRAGVDGPHGPHRWRHTHASACAETGMTVPEIGKRLGHSLENLHEGNNWEVSTVRYIHLSDDYLAHVVDRALPAPVADDVVIPPLPGYTAEL